MEDYEYKVIKLHATLFQNSSVGRRQWREDTRESGSRRFYLGNSSSFGGYFEIFFAFGLRGSELLMLVGSMP